MISRRDQILFLLDELAATDRPEKPCTPEEHNALKADPSRWREETAALGHQTDGEGGVMELRNCYRCSSTLARSVPTEMLEVTP